MKNTQKRLQEIHDEIVLLTNIQKQLSLDMFLANPYLQRCVAMSLINIGECAKHLLAMGFSSEIFRQIIGIRNITAHNFAALKMDKVWDFVEYGIPRIKIEMDRITNDVL